MTHSSGGSARPDPTDTGPFQTGRVVSITGAHAVHDTYTAFLPPLLPAFISKLTLSKTEAGALTVFMQAPSVFLPYIGFLADRLTLRYIVVVAPVVTALAMSLLGIAPRYAVLALLLTVAGLSSAAFHSVAPVMAGRLSGPNLGRGMGLWMVGGELGRTLGPLVIVTTVSFLTLEGTTWLVTGGILASILLYILLKDVPEQPPEAAQPVSFRHGLRLFRPLLVPLVGIVTGRVFMLAALTTYLPVFLMEEGSAFWFAGVALTVLEAAGVAGALIGGSLSDRLGRRLVLFVTMLCAPLLMLVFLTAQGWPRFVLLLPMGFTALAVAPVMMALVQESFPESRALANGVYLALSFVIRSAAVVALGASADIFGLHTAYAVSAVVPLLSLPFLLRLPERSA